MSDWQFFGNYPEYLGEVPGAAEQADNVPDHLRVEVNRRLAEAMMMQWMASGPLRSGAVSAVPALITMLLSRSAIGTLIGGVAGSVVAYAGNKFARWHLNQYANKCPNAVLHCTGSLLDQMQQGSGDEYPERVERWKSCLESVPDGIRRRIGRWFVWLQTTASLKFLLEQVSMHCAAVSVPLRGVLDSAKDDLFDAREKRQRQLEEELVNRARELERLSCLTDDLGHTDAHHEERHEDAEQRLARLEMMMDRMANKLGPLFEELVLEDRPGPRKIFLVKIEGRKVADVTRVKDPVGGSAEEAQQQQDRSQSLKDTVHGV